MRKVRKEGQFFIIGTPKFLLDFFHKKRRRIKRLSGVFQTK